MQIYLVGGAVRDALLGLPVQDRDWVVVGSSPEDMAAQGFVPVGKDFPVFLHPDTQEEYALARTERKTGRGYRGFVVHADAGVTLDQDLARRDITINSIALPAANAWTSGQKGIKNADLKALIDPWGGQRDLQARVLRHVTAAFAEDPVRILRLARFAARFPDFSVAPETMALMQQMVADGEADALVPERVWQELARGLMATRPSRMLTVLKDCGALQRLLPEVAALWCEPHRTASPGVASPGHHLMRVLDIAAEVNAPLTVRFACLCQDIAHHLDAGAPPADALPGQTGRDAASALARTGVYERWRVPTACSELADVVARERNAINSINGINGSASLNPVDTVRLLERCDAFRKPARFAEALLACECTARGRDQPGGPQASPYPQRPLLLAALAAAQAVATQPIAQAAQAAGRTGPEIGALIHAARVEAVAAAAGV